VGSLQKLSNICPSIWKALEIKMRDMSCSEVYIDTKHAKGQREKISSLTI